MHGRNPIRDVFIPRRLLVAIRILVEQDPVVLHRPGDAGLLCLNDARHLLERPRRFRASAQIARQAVGAFVPRRGIRIGQHLAQLLLGSRSGVGIDQRGLADEGARGEVGRDAVPGRRAVAGNAEEIRRCRVELACVEFRRGDLIGAVRLHPTSGGGRQRCGNGWPPRLRTVREHLVLRSHPGPQIVVRSNGTPTLDQRRSRVAECIVAAVQDIGMIG